MSKKKFRLSFFLLTAAQIFCCIMLIFGGTAKSQELSVMPGTDPVTGEDRALLDRIRKTGRNASARPVVSKEGEVRFVYGASSPVVVCSLLHVCDIALQPGETVVDIRAGDSNRWLIERSASGSESGIIEHVAVKPADTGLTTNLRIYTDRRTYGITLKSSLAGFMPAVSFIYPEDIGYAAEGSVKEAKELLAAKQSKADKDSQKVEAERTAAVSPDSLDFEYEFSGDEELFPLRVFNDGRQTYIRLGNNMPDGRLPALAAVSDGGWFEDDGVTVLNYRLRNGSFVADGVPSHLRLMSGDGSISCDIRRKGK